MHEDKDHKYWEAIIRQCIISGHIIKEIENYGILKVSKKGVEFISNPVPFELVKAHTYSDDDADSGGNIQQKGGGAADEELFNILKDLRKKLGSENGLPPYVIFQDPSLEDMATRYPVTMEELTNITGVGQGKAEKYGQRFIDAISRYVKENEIERPMDMVVKSIVNKSGLKVFIIQSIDRKMSIEDIAKAKGKESNDVLTEIEHIVASGTKVNLDYIINDLLDEDYQEEIFDYFKETQQDCIQAAFEEFDEVYSEDELRMMRIKFLSEVGN